MTRTTTIQRLFLASIGLVAIGTLATRVSAAADDQTFVDTAWHANADEVTEARYVLQHTRDAKTREFAQMMIDDHTTANVKLLAAARKVPLATPSSSPANAASASGAPVAAPAGLSGLSGAALSKAYFAMAVSDHKTALDLFSSEASGGSAASLRAYASETEPTVRKHYDLASQWVSSGGKLPATFVSGPAPAMPATSTPMMGEAPGAGATTNPQPTSSSVVATPLPTSTPGPP
jgi:putative membrane protein